MIGQLGRYGVVGLLSNAAGFLLYVTLTAAGMGPKMAMSLLYAVGVVQTFVFNQRWSFRHRGSMGPAFARYCGAYALGYAVNLAALCGLVDGLEFPHQIVQGLMILVLAFMLFLLQKFWVFRAAPPLPASSGLPR